MVGPLARLLAGIKRTGEAVFAVENGPTAGERYKFWPYRRWEAVCAAAEVPSVAYDLRHTFITEMVVKGVQLPKIAKWAGNSVRVIEERYSHLSPEFLMDVADNVTCMDSQPLPKVALVRAPDAEDDDLAALE